MITLPQILLTIIVSAAIYTACEMIYKKIKTDKRKYYGNKNNQTH